MCFCDKFYVHFITYVEKSVAQKNEICVACVVRYDSWTRLTVLYKLCHSSMIMGGYMTKCVFSVFNRRKVFMESCGFYFEILL